MRRLLFIIGIIIALFFTKALYAQEQTRAVRTESIEDLRKDKAFDYIVAYKTADNPLERIWNWILYQLFRLLSFGTNSTFGTILFYCIMAAILIYAIVKIFNIPILNAIYGSGKAKNLLGEIHEDINEIDFDARIEAAFKKGDYREVVRLYYLRSLQLLDQMKVIKWEIGKTNLDYLYEIRNAETKSKLSSLNYYFEYAIYGDFPISEQLARDSKKLYHSINENQG